MLSINKAIPNIDKKFRTKYYLTKEADETVQEIIIHKSKGDEVRKRRGHQEQNQLTKRSLNQ